MDSVKKNTKHKFLLSNDEVLKFRNRICVPQVRDLRREILEEAHNSRFSIHPGGTNMYRGMRQLYWWLGQKQDIAHFVAQCLTCQQVKVEHQHPIGQSQPPPIPKWN
ncbi:hypothetical protein CK203_046494 [Vitis vinifera]|uniref:Integrase zinc-binding domain-containing protein n=1 Tax=Vitis vinifera TaxID=29760 RepID=A0A438ILF8_VITVI|nr:hypothetical protein CK203_046494 [Vitis vinifera]